VQQSYNPHNGFTSTKNDKIRELPLTWDAIAALKAQRELVDTDSEFVFPGADDKVLSANRTNEVLADISEAAGIRRIHNHCLRHSFASHAVMRGIPIRQVQEWLGHGSIVVTMRYAHLAHGIGDELIRRLAPTPDDAAKSQHIHSPQIWRSPNPGPHTPIEPLN